MKRKSGPQPDGGFIMDDGRDPFSPVCTFCRHSKGFVPGSCKAFPGEDAIPGVIWEDRNKHTEPFAGDHGIHFEMT